MPTMKPDITFTSPCDRNWEAMPGDDSVRYCDGCQRFVPNLSALTTDEQRALLASPSRPKCVFLRPQAGGRVQSRGGGLPRLTFTVALAAGAAAAMALSPAAPTPEPVEVPAPAPAPVPEPLSHLSDEELATMVEALDAEQRRRVRALMGMVYL